MSNTTTSQNCAKLETVIASVIGGDWGKDSPISSDYLKVKVIRGTDLSKWDKKKGADAAERYINKSSLTKRQLRSGDIVIEISGGGPTQPVGRSILIDDALLNSTSLPVVCSNFFRKIRLQSSVNPSFLNHFFTYTHSIGGLDKYQTQTTNLRNLNFTKLTAELEIPLPDKSLQDKISKRLDKLLPQIKETRSQLDNIPSLLKRFRQSVLFSACSGHLTEDWREQNKDIESAHELLARIRASRLRTASSIKEKLQVTSSPQYDENSTTRPNSHEVPNSWLVCQIGDIGTVTSGSTPSRKCSQYWGGNIPWVSSGEVKNNIILSTREKITKTGLDSCSVRILPQGTILLAMIGEGKTRGQSAILKIAAATNQNIAAILLTHGLVCSEYLWYWFQFQYEATREQGAGSGPQALNGRRVRELPCFLPPLLEQQEIVARVKSFFQLSDSIVEKYQSARAKTDKLTHSILAKAFRGEFT